MRVTVTGATGAIGLASVQMLVRAGHAVRAFVQSPEEFYRTSPEERAEVVAGDILDRAAVAAAMDGADAAVHCASLPARHFALNWDVLRHVFEGLPTGAHLIYPSNWVHRAPVALSARPDRRERLLPRLGTLAADMEKEVLAQGSTVVRLPWCYGPGDRKGPVHLMIERILAGKIVWFPGDLDRPLDLIYLEDAARALVAPLGHRKARGTDYEAPGFPAIAPREVAAIVSQVAGQPMRLRSLPIAWLRALAPLHVKLRAMCDLADLLERPSAGLDGAAIRRDLGWKPEVDHSEGIHRTVRWFRRFWPSSGDRLGANLAPYIHLR